LLWLVAGLLCFYSSALPAQSRTANPALLHQQVKDCLDVNPARSLRVAQQLKALCNQPGYKLLLPQSLIDLSYCYRRLENMDSAIYYAKAGIVSAQEISSDSLKASACAVLGDLFFKKGLHDSAVFYQLKSLKLREAIGSKPQIINSLYNLGAICNAIGKKAQSYSYFEECLKRSLAYKEPSLRAMANEGMASWCLSNDEYKKAVAFYSQAGTLYSDLNDKEGTGRCLLNLGSAYDMSDLPVESIRCYKKALALFEKLGLEKSILVCYDNLGATYGGMGKISEALLYHKKAQVLAEKIGALDELKVIYENISDTYRQKGNADSALVFFQKSSQVKDSILNIENLNYINELQEKYNKEKRESEIKALKEEDRLKDAEMRVQQKRAELMVITICLLIILTLLTFFILRQRAGNAKAMAQKNEQLYRRKINEIIKEQELKSISSMMEGQENERKRIAKELHDRLGSMLATIKLHFNAIEQKMDKLELKSIEQYNNANKLLDEVCDEVRKIAHNMESGVLVNFGLVHALTDLKEALQQSSHLSIQFGSFGMGERLSNAIEINVYRVLQELLSNVIRHSGATEVSIDLNRTEQQLTIIFSDNGTGYITENTGHQGMGLKNIRSRIAKLGGKFYVDSGKQNGTTNIIEIPLKDGQTLHS